MSLDQLAKRIIAISETGQSTIVLVTPPEFSLMPAFFIELVESIRRVSDESLINRLNTDGVEIDYFQHPGGRRSLFSDLRHRRQTAKLQQALDRQTTLPTLVRWTAILGRPSHEGPIVIGCCDSQQPLPSWAKAVELARLPTAA